MSNDITPGRGLYEVGLQYQLKRGAKIETQYFEPFLANDPKQAFLKAVNQLFIMTGKEPIIKDNIITYIIPDANYFD